MNRRNAKESGTQAAVRQLGVHGWQQERWRGIFARDVALRQFVDDGIEVESVSDQVVPACYAIVELTPETEFPLAENLKKMGFGPFAHFVLTNRDQVQAVGFNGRSVVLVPRGQRALAYGTPMG